MPPPIRLAACQMRDATSASIELREAIPREYAGRLLPVDAEVSARWGELDAEAR